MLYEVGRKYVDVKLVRPYVWVERGHLSKTFVPVRHTVNDAVRLGRRRQVLLRSAAGQVESVTKHTVDAYTREHRLLDHHFRRRSFVNPSTYLRVLSFIVLPHNDKIDVFWLPVGQRRSYPGQQPDRSQIDILLEPPADRN